MAGYFDPLGGKRLREYNESRPGIFEVARTNYQKGMNGYVAAFILLFFLFFPLFGAVHQSTGVAIEYFVVLDAIFVIAIMVLWNTRPRRIPTTGPKTGPMKVAITTQHIPNAIGHTSYYLGIDITISQADWKAR